jgi:hypothetical protein
MGARLKPAERNVAAAADAPPVRSGCDPRQRGIDFCKVLTGLREHGLGLGPLERQCGALRVVLVVGGGVATSSEKRTHLLGEALNQESGLLPVPCEVIPQ